MDYTPKQLHYFKRELITLQLEKEINKLIASPDLSSLLDTPTGDTEFPFLRYIFHNIIIEFPLLKHTCDDQFWPKCKLFLNEFGKVGLDGYHAPRHTQGALQRKAVKHKIQKSLVFAFCASIKTFQGAEESMKVTTLPPPVQEGTTETKSSSSTVKINIVTVRQVKEKKTLREISHAEFLIETVFPNNNNDDEPVYVARRHGDFRRLRESLRQEFKQLDIPPVPSKAHTTDSKGSGYREHDRLLLRTWLHQLVGEKDAISPSQHLISQSSQGLRQFLTDNPITFTMAEEQDTLEREKSDQQRWLQQQDAQRELDRRVLELDDTLDVLKKQILQPGGLIGIFNTIKSTSQVVDLPPSLKKAFEWGRINFAFALHRQFLTSDIAAENYNNLRRTHGLMPYRTMSVILRFSNPMFMVKSILDLFLAQPFGGRSLFQRLIISNMNEESKAFQKDIEILEKKIGDKTVCKKLFNAVRTPLVSAGDKSELSGWMEVLALLENNEIEPVLSAEQIGVIISKRKAKWMKRCSRLWELYARVYEQELMMNLVFQGVTGDLLKEFIAVFYQPLAEVYKAADIGTTLRHVSDFLDDLILVIDGLKGKEGEVSDTVQAFVDLVARHEQHFYAFVHNVHSQEASKVFDELIHYVDGLFTFMAQGIPGKIDMNHGVEKAGFTRPKEIELLEYEIDAICEYRYKQKMYRFERTKRKLMMQQEQVTGDGLLSIREQEEKEMHDQVFQYIPKSSEMMNAIQDYHDFDDEDDEEGEKSENSGSESDSDTESSIPSRRSSKSSGSHVSHAGIDKPVLTLIPQIVPYFVDDVVAMMSIKKM
ncbi:hypothetical protein INT47_009748 [Mucor saturninus]|uniref:PX domain-containing protein n=1 Tax=Mucor saturninus TaxID=64648 RepID=A0A8H7UWV7_9FUNG|nr:hypothetical protein INT47_009748 [Mucor saturninus]